MDGAGIWMLPLCILAAAVGLIVWHVRVWRQVRADENRPVKDVEFAQRQCRRRIQCSTMLAVLAVGLLVAPWIASPTAQLVLGLLMLLLAIWLGLLAVGDLILTRYHYERLQNDCLVERAKLEIEARRLCKLAGNGHPARAPSNHDDSTSP